MGNPDQTGDKYKNYSVDVTDGYGAGTYMAWSDSIYKEGTKPAWNPAGAFDRDTGRNQGYHSFRAPSASDPVHLYFQVPSPINVHSYIIGARSGCCTDTQAPKTWRLEASGEGAIAAWRVLDEQSGISGWRDGEERAFDTSFVNHRFSVFRLVFLETQKGHALSLKNIRFMSRAGGFWSLPPEGIASGGDWEKTKDGCPNDAPYDKYVTKVDFGYAKGAYSAESNSIYAYGTGDEWPASGAFDGRLAASHGKTGWASDPAKPGPNGALGTLMVSVPVAITPRHYVLSARADCCEFQNPIKWKLEARVEKDESKDETSPEADEESSPTNTEEWISLDERAAYGGWRLGERRTFSVENLSDGGFDDDDADVKPQTFRHFRLTVSQVANHGVLSVSDFTLFTSTDPGASSEAGESPAPEGAQPDGSDLGEHCDAPAPAELTKEPDLVPETDILDEGEPIPVDGGRLLNGTVVPVCVDEPLCLVSVRFNAWCLREDQKWVAVRGGVVHISVHRSYFWVVDRVTRHLFYADRIADDPAKTKWKLVDPEPKTADRIIISSALKAKLFAVSWEQTLKSRGVLGTWSALDSPSVVSVSADEDVLWVVTNESEACVRDTTGPLGAASPSDWKCFPGRKITHINARGGHAFAVHMEADGNDGEIFFKKGGEPAGWAPIEGDMGGDSIAGGVLTSLCGGTSESGGARGAMESFYAFAVNRQGRLYYRFVYALHPGVGQWQPILTTQTWRPIDTPCVMPDPAPAVSKYYADNGKRDGDDVCVQFVFIAWCGRSEPSTPICFPYSKGPYHKPIIQQGLYYKDSDKGKKYFVERGIKGYEIWRVRNATSDQRVEGILVRKHDRDPELASFHHWQPGYDDQSEDVLGPLKHPAPPKSPTNGCVDSRKRLQNGWVYAGWPTDALWCKRECKRRRYTMMGLECPVHTSFECWCLNNKGSDELDDASCMGRPDVTPELTGGSNGGCSGVGFQGEFWHGGAWRSAVYPTGYVTPPFTLIKNRVSGLCIEAVTGHRGQRISMASCDEHRWSQRWTMDEGTGLIRSLNDPANACIDSPHRRSRGAIIHLWTCDQNNGNQLWRFKRNKNGLLKNRNGGICIDTPHRDSPGTYLHMWHCDRNNANQQWDMTF